VTVPLRCCRAKMLGDAAARPVPAHPDHRGRGLTGMAGFGVGVSEAELMLPPHLSPDPNRGPYRFW
jgi:hypothetical protein